MRSFKGIRSALPGIFLLAACASGPQSAESISNNGPTVVSTRTTPETIEVDSRFQTKTRADVFAEVKDFSSEIMDVKLKFVHVPIEVDMVHISGTTWRATLSSEQVKTLAIGNQTTEHEAKITATNADGATGTSQTPIMINVKAPDLAGSSGKQT